MAVCASAEKLEGTRRRHPLDLNIAGREPGAVAVKVGAPDLLQPQSVDVELKRPGIGGGAECWRLR
jgi:hypothetical protein